MATNMSSFFDELVEAKRAVESLPIVQSQLDELNSKHLELANDHQNALDHADQLQRVIDAQKAELAEKEAALSDATFRESGVRAQLEMLVGTFKTVIGEASSAVDLVEPKPLPVVGAPTIAPTTDFVGNDTAAKPSGERDTDPTSAAASNIGTTMQTEGPNATEGSSAGLASLTPNTASPYWLKPDSVTWATWIGLGHEYPSWINGDGSQKGGYNQAL